MKNIITTISLSTLVLFTIHLNIIAKGINQFPTENLMHSPYNVSPQHPSIDTRIKVVDIAKNTFIAAGVINANNGKPNYAKQAPVDKKTNEYIFNSNTYYAVITKNGYDFTSQHIGTDFIGYSTWNARKNIIS
ncbi:hypothetical protein [Candidatus Chromulinivorax destructor]|uniref:Uncharacterized protein n=1 Tax=Candidatus Chromulinivorax destructor TaxID=2066483 RepID=A0A345ZAA1_9BACT|nr:hypothetical protein [Candidatus Chromulinivorax destructor]AXK60218.1 hypothetical protein C0J27_00435 [Candidatus Chromulinivorax destructor]